MNARNQKRQKELNHDILVYELNIKKVIFGKVYSMIKVLKLFLFIKGKIKYPGFFFSS